METPQKRHQCKFNLQRELIPWGSYNAWYTLQPEIEDKVDFVIFNYTDAAQHINSLVISNETLRDACKNQEDS